MPLIAVGPAFEDGERHAMPGSQVKTARMAPDRTWRKSRNLGVIERQAVRAVISYAAEAGPQDKYNRRTERDARPKVRDRRDNR